MNTFSDTPYNYVCSNPTLDVLSDISNNNAGRIQDKHTQDKRNNQNTIEYETMQGTNAHMSVMTW